MLKRGSPVVLLLAAIAAGLVGFFAGSVRPARAELVPQYEYKAFSIIEFEVQGEKIPGQEWVAPSHLDLAHKKIGNALLKDRAIMTNMLNGMAAEGWEPMMIYQNVLIARRPAPR